MEKIPSESLKPNDQDHLMLAGDKDIKAMIKGGTIIFYIYLY
jgi:hypothetical protein